MINLLSFLILFYGLTPSLFAITISNEGVLPPVTDVAKMARYIVHNADWTVISHISHHANSSGFPQGRVFSISDGPVEKSSGTPYIYTSLLDPVMRDLQVDSRCGMTMSLAQGSYCKNNNLDPENPLCAQVMLSGYFQFISSNDKEADFAKQALFSRHTEMKTWPADHNFQFGKLNISDIQIIDYYGGSKYPSISEYYNAVL